MSQYTKSSITTKTGTGVGSNKIKIINSGSNSKNTGMNIDKNKYTHNNYQKQNKSSVQLNSKANLTFKIIRKEKQKTISFQKLDAFNQLRLEQNKAKKEVIGYYYLHNQYYVQGKVDQFRLEPQRIFSHIDGFEMQEEIGQKNQMINPKKDSKQKITIWLKKLKNHFSKMYNDYLQKQIQHKIIYFDSVTTSYIFKKIKSQQDYQKKWEEFIKNYQKYELIFVWSEIIKQKLMTVALMKIQKNNFFMIGDIQYTFNNFRQFNHIQKFFHLEINKDIKTLRHFNTGQSLLLLLQKFYKINHIDFAFIQKVQLDSVTDIDDYNSDYKKFGRDLTDNKIIIKDFLEYRKNKGKVLPRIYRKYNIENLKI